MTVKRDCNIGLIKINYNQQQPSCGPKQKKVLFTYYTCMPYISINCNNSTSFNLRSLSSDLNVFSDDCSLAAASFSFCSFNLKTSISSLSFQVKVCHE